ncbi:unnamed protein product [Parajaminaea phylloscopi]
MIEPGQQPLPTHKIDTEEQRRMAAVHAALPPKAALEAATPVSAPASHRAAKMLALPDALLLVVAAKLTPIDAFKLSLTCARLHRLMLFGILEAFCHNCSTPLLVSREQLLIRGWPALTAREYDFWPDAVPHLLCQRWFCMPCIRLPAFQFIGENRLADWNVALHDMADVPFWIVDGMRWFRLLHVTEKAAHRRALLAQQQQQQQQRQEAHRGWSQAVGPYHAYRHSGLRESSRVSAMPLGIPPMATIAHGDFHRLAGATASHWQDPLAFPHLPRPPMSHDAHSAIYPRMHNHDLGHGTQDHPDVVSMLAPSTVSQASHSDAGAGAAPQGQVSDKLGRAAKHSRSASGAGKTSEHVVRKRHRRGTTSLMAAEQVAWQTRAHDAELQQTDTGQAKQAKKPKRKQPRSKNMRKGLVGQEPYNVSSPSVTATGADRRPDKSKDSNAAPALASAVAFHQERLRDDDIGSGLGSDSNTSSWEIAHTEPVQSDAEARRQIMQDVKREQLAQALAGRGYTLTTTAMSHEDIKLWVEGDWLSMAAKGIHDLPGLIDNLIGRYGTASEEGEGDVAERTPHSPTAGDGKEGLRPHDQQDEELGRERVAKQSTPHLENLEAPEASEAPEAPEVPALPTATMATAEELRAAALYAEIHLPGPTPGFPDTQDPLGIESQSILNETSRSFDSLVEQSNGSEVPPGFGADATIFDRHAAFDVSPPAVSNGLDTSAEGFGLGHLYSTLTTSGAAEDSLPDLSPSVAAVTPLTDVGTADVTTERSPSFRDADLDQQTPLVAVADNHCEP